MKISLVALAGALALCAAPASAGDGDQFTFEVVNGTTAEVTGMWLRLTNGGWGDNWVRSPIATPGVRMMRFRDTDARCSIRVRVTFSDGDVFEDDVDFCTIDGILLENDGIKPF